MDFMNGWAKREGPMGYVRNGQKGQEDGPIRAGDSFVVRHIGGALVFARYERDLHGFLTGQVHALHPWPIVPGLGIAPGDSIGARMDEILTVIRKSHSDPHKGIYAGLGNGSSSSAPSFRELLTRELTRKNSTAVTSLSSDSAKARSLSVSDGSIQGSYASGDRMMGIDRGPVWPLPPQPLS